MLIKFKKASHLSLSISKAFATRTGGSQFFIYTTNKEFKYGIGTFWVDLVLDSKTDQYTNIKINDIVINDIDSNKRSTEYLLLPIIKSLDKETVIKENINTVLDFLNKIINNFNITILPVKATLKRDIGISTQKGKYLKTNEVFIVGVSDGISVCGTDVKIFKSNIKRWGIDKSDILYVNKI